MGRDHGQRIGAGVLMDGMTVAKIMGEPFECDVCSEITPASDRHVLRQPRPSDPSDWCGVMWACGPCAPTLGARSEAYWNEWIESDEAREVGALFLS